MDVVTCTAGGPSKVGPGSCAGRVGVCGRKEISASVSGCGLGT